MQIYHYDNKTGEPIGNGQADKDQKQPDNFLIPAYATPKQPPELLENTAAVYLNAQGIPPRKHDAGTWSLIADYRGYIGYDETGAEKKITELGIEPGESWTLSPPPKPFDFATAFAQKNTEIISGFKQAMLPIRENYTDEEIASFPTQEPEALTWQADNNAATPLIDGILAERVSVDKSTLVSRIINNAATYKAVAGPAIGKKQHLEDQLYALLVQHEDTEQPEVTQADFDNIVVDFS